METCPDMSNTRKENPIYKSKRTKQLSGQCTYYNTPVFLKNKSINKIQTEDLYDVCKVMHFTKVNEKRDK